MPKQAVNFVHLNCHSEYSIVDGILRIKPFLERVRQLGMQSVALTDQSNLFAMVKFYKAAISLGIKPIIGCDIWLDHADQRLTLLCQNYDGLQNLMKLVSKSYKNWQQSKPVVKKSWLYADNSDKGLIAIAPMLDSNIGKSLINNNLDLAFSLSQEWQDLFGDRFYLAITKINHAIEENILRQILQIATENIPIVATGDVRFLEPQDFIAHEARVCINQGLRLDNANRKKIYTEQQYLKNSEQIIDLFKDVPESIINAVEISKRCNLKLNLGKSYLPKYDTPNNTSEKDYLIEEAKQGLVARLNCNNYQEISEKYTQRLAAEIAVINTMGFAGYFLIVADIIRWALQQKIPIGPGRGSGAGSLVAFALHITNIDPLSQDLLFERFLNPERVSMPDFDIDFCINGRDLVIDYVVNKYGRNSVAQIITYGTMAAKAAIRDVGRVLGSPYGFVDQIAKLIPLELGMTISKALEQENQLKIKYEEDEEVKSIIDLAIKLEGITRNVGKHAGGVVIAPTDIVNFSPIFCEENGDVPVTQFDKNDIEDIGLVKFDFLGLRTLTIIDWAVKAININANNNQQFLDINKIPLHDIKTFEFLCSGNTTAVFQLESRGMRELTIKLQPNRFEDLIAIGALYRPGPLQSGMVDDFIDRKRGKKAIKYPHPDLESILNNTYGVIVYQEQVMQIAQVLAGYTLGSADLLRRAMGKKKSEEMAKQREIFICGSVSRGVNPEQASNIFDLMEKFSKYGFPKPHATAYALITYQTAWLKNYYPAEFMAAVLSSELAHTDKIILFIIDCKKNGITILAPNINTGYYNFVAVNPKEINYGLGAIKGVGENAINNIIEARKQGIFKNLLDLCERVDLHKVSRKTLEALIKAGALDCFNLHRAALLAFLEPVIKIVNKTNSSCNKQLNLFTDLLIDEPKIVFTNDICSEWEKHELFNAEKEAFGFYFSNHPISEFAQELLELGVIKFSHAQLDNKIQKFAGLIVGIRISNTKKGDKIAFVTIDDAVSRQEVIIFADLYNDNRNLLKKDKLIILEGEVKKDNYTGGLRVKCNKLMDLDCLRQKHARNLTVVLNTDISQDSSINTDHIKNIIKSYPGSCPLTIHYKKSGILTKVKLGVSWHIDPKLQLLTDLKMLPEIEDAYINY